MRAAAAAGPPAGVLTYLNSALSARGAGALPYAEDLKWSVREHIVQLLQARCAAA
jgi:ESCRT-I complex subunit TSG101